MLISRVAWQLGLGVLCAGALLLSGCHLLLPGAAAIGAGAAAAPAATSLLNPTTLSDAAALACSLQGYANSKVPKDEALSIIAGGGCVWKDVGIFP